MLRVSSRVCGSYLLNQRVIADWWQPRYRERMHNAAKEKLNAALQETNNAEQPAPAPSDGMDGAADGASSSVPSSGSSPASPPPPLLSLYDANALVSTFVSNHNTEDLSATLQYIREHLGQELTPFHFHALLRNFNYHRDTSNALQLLEVMMQSGTMTLETYARMADCIHVQSPSDAQARLLQLVALAQEAFGGQVMIEGVGSEGATTAQYSTGEEGRRAREAEMTDTPVAMASEASSSPQSTFQPRSAPLLSSLLYHLSTTQNAHTVASCVLVALWIRALGVELTDWDVLTVLSTIATHTEQFPRLCVLFGHYDGFQRGHVSAQAVLDRLVLLGEVDQQGLFAGSSSATASTEGRSSAKHVAAPSPFTALAAAMRASLRAAGGDAALRATISLPFVNAQTNDVEQMAMTTLEPLLRDGVGAHRYSAAHLLHALSLVSSTVRDDVGAMELLMRSIAEQAKQAEEDDRAEAVLRAATEAQEGDGNTPSTPLTPAAVAEATTQLEQQQLKHRDGCPAAEPFAVPVHHLIDMGSVLNRMSASTLRAVQQPFRSAIRRLVSELPDAPLSDNINSNSGASSFAALAIASCHPPIATARDLVKLSNYETQFIRTVAEAREVLRNAVDSASAGGGGQGWLPGSTQLMFFQLAEFCCRHPPRNPKLTPAGLEERTKWARYLDARDTSLALFGSARQSRDSMKHLFYHDNQLPALRSAAVIAKDFADMHRIFFGDAVPQPTSPCATQAELQEALLRTRTTLPHAGSCEATVPRYLWDPAVYNPYPAAQLANNSSSCTGVGSARAAFTTAEIHQLDPALDGAASGGDDDDDGGEAAAASEFFVELWHALLDKTTAVGSNEVWYLQNTGMYLLLTRCLLHRLDWEAAVHLTRKMTQHASYNYMMDHELTTIFKEIGDPAGCLAFKVATKLFDGRITKDGQSKRDKMEQEQFS